MLWFKFVVVFVLILVLLSLGSGLFFFIQDDPKKSKRLVSALTVRVILSVLLFTLLIIGFVFGWIKPHGLLG